MFVDGNDLEFKHRDDLCISTNFVSWMSHGIDFNIPLKFLKLNSLCLLPFLIACSNISKLQKYLYFIVKNAPRPAVKQQLSLKRTIVFLCGFHLHKINSCVNYCDNSAINRILNITKMLAF